MSEPRYYIVTRDHLGELGHRCGSTEAEALADFIEVYGEDGLVVIKGVEMRPITEPVKPIITGFEEAG